MPADRSHPKKESKKELPKKAPEVTTRALVKVERSKKPAKEQGLFDRVINLEISTKTFLLSHLALLIFGLIFLSGLYYILNDGIFFCCKTSGGLQNYLPVTKKPSSIELNITAPEDEQLLYEKSIVFKGKTTPLAILLLTNLTTDENLGFEASNKGDFSKVVTLNEGLNEFTITAFDSEGNKKSEARTVFYSEEKIQ
jgi:hypothetical protein